MVEGEARLAIGGVPGMSRPKDKLAAALEMVARGEYRAATDALMALARRDPRDAEVGKWLCVALAHEGRFAEAAAHGERAFAGRERDAELATSLGTIAFNRGRLEESVKWLERALAIEPGLRDARLGLMDTVSAMGDHARVVELARGTLALGDAGYEAWMFLGPALHEIGRVEEACAVVDRACGLFPGVEVLASLRCALHAYDPGTDARTMLGIARAYGASAARAVGGLAREFVHAGRRDPERVLRVGLICGDLRAHSTQYFVQPLFTHRDSARVFLACYHTGAAEDARAGWFRERCDLWRRVDPQAPGDACATIRADAIDVLIDLAGHTTFHALLTLALRAAPVQATWIGYPCTTGVGAIDFRVSDRWTDPAGHEIEYVERLARMEGGQWHYAPAQGLPSLDGADALVVGHAQRPATFVCFNALKKLNPRVLGLWAGAMRAAPEAVLLVKCRGLEVASVREEFLAMAERAGIARARVIAEGPAAGTPALLGHYLRGDVALDSHPYCGVTTTCEALVMGVPVVTRVAGAGGVGGGTAASRQARSLLVMAGESAGVCEDDEAFARMAAATLREVVATRRAGADMERRRAMRARVLASALCDSAGFAARFEAMVRGWWRAWMGGEGA